MNNQHRASSISRFGDRSIPIMVRFQLLALLASLAALVTAPAAYSEIMDRADRTISGYHIVHYKYEWYGVFGGLVQIWKGKKKLVEVRDHDAWIYSLDKQVMSFEIGPREPVQVKDLTGDGIKDLIVESWSGGVHAAYTFDIYSLGPKLQHIGHFFGRNGHLFVRTPKQGLPELWLEDDRDYLASKGNLSNMPLNVLRWNGTRFVKIRSDVPHDQATWIKWDPVL